MKDATYVNSVDDAMFVSALALSARAGGQDRFTAQTLHAEQVSCDSLMSWQALL
ncbi:hypothetical protein PO002_31370 [Cupriavidus necator]|uniref:hypothetical protein n=1 Tax=Cupriavidus necator TaxID=106590 RepID=UPI0039C282EF